MSQSWQSIIFSKRALGSLCFLLFCYLLLPAPPLSAHAVLVRTEPAANSIAAQPPAEIRLWFTEPLEPNFSRIRLRDSTGAAVDTTPSQVDSTDALQMVLPLDTLPDGLYSVSWQVVSSADGHQTAGNFPFTVGDTVSTASVAAPTDTPIPTLDAVIRWINILGLAMAVGSIGFVYFVWQPALPYRWAAAERRLHQILGWSWLFLGIGSLLLLFQQAANLTGLALPNLSTVLEVLQSTRFGLLWMVRMGLWLLLGGMLFLSSRWPALYVAALLLGAGVLATQSLYSHAAAAPEPALAVLVDWVHLLLTALWLGGLLAFGFILPVMWRAEPANLSIVARLVGYFSNYARLGVAGLTVTGLYAGWLQVGSWEALTTTRYGTVFLIKLLLLMPLLLLAAVNLLLTRRRLQAGDAIWLGRLRGLLGAELLLGLAVVGAVGVMTAINPARNELQQREIAAAVPLPPEPMPITDMQMVDPLHVQLTLSPGWVGENTFTIALFTLADNQPVTDASLIRLRFESQSANLGESELRITEATDGVYQVTGSNLSAPGDWQLRMTIQRPQQFDIVTDFLLSVPTSPPPSPPAVVDLAAPYPNRQLILLLSGGLALVLGGYSLVQRSNAIEPRSRLLAGGLCVLGCLFVGSAFWP